jgi:hypothetical protein
LIQINSIKSLGGGTGESGVSLLHGLKTEDKELLQKIAGRLADQDSGELYREIIKKLLLISDREQLLRYIDII